VVESSLSFFFFSARESEASCHISLSFLVIGYSGPGSSSVTGWRFFFFSVDDG